MAKSKNKFQPGDTVQLLAGGPKMTVKERVTNWEGQPISPEQYVCQWFKGASMQEGKFPATSLKKVEASD